MAVKSVNPYVQIISVESECASGFYASMKGITDDFMFLIYIHISINRRIFIAAGQPILTECHSTLADGLAVPLVGANAYATAAPLTDKVVCVRLVSIKEKQKII